MPARQDGRIEKGQSIKTAISARAWNRAQDAADVVLGVRPGFEADGGGAYGAPYSRIKVQAVFAENAPAWPRWSPVFLMSALHGYVPTTNPSTDQQKAATSSFESMPIFHCYGNPAYTSYNSQMVGVLLEPLKAGQIGWAAVSGIVQTKIFNKAANRLNSEHMGALYAKLKGGDEQGPAKLVTDWFEGYRILWREHGRQNEDAWALIDLSNHHCQQLVLMRTTQAIQFGQKGACRPLAFWSNQSFELPDDVTVKNDLMRLEANVYVWALHPGSSDLFESWQGWKEFKVVCLANMNDSFEALAQDNGTNSWGNKRYSLTLKSYSIGPPLN